MNRAYLLPVGADLLDFVCGRIEGSKPAESEKTLILFPNRRPAVVLARKLVRRAGRAIMAPACHSIDDWTEAEALRQGLKGQKIEAADGAALIYQLHPDRRLPGGKSVLSLEEFLAWGFTLFADFEDLCKAGVTQSELESVQELASEPLPENFGRQLLHLGQWYGDFYRQLKEQEMYTSASACRFVAEKAKEIDVSGHPLVILAGFYGLTQSEQAICSELLGRDNVIMVFRDGPGMDRTFGQLSIKPEKIGEGRPGPRIKFFRAGDSHGQVLQAVKEIRPGPKLSETLLALPKEDTVFPVIQHLLPRLEGDWNISMGYPLSRTPLYGLVEALAQAHEGRDGENYFLPHYLQLMLHPYIKNLSLDGASYPTRILLHGLEEILSRDARRLVAPSKIGRDGLLQDKLDRKLSGLLDRGFDREKMLGHLDWIHNLVLTPFEEIKSLADFADKMTAVVSEVAGRSPANRHPYAEDFFDQMISALAELKNSLLAGERFREVRTYFGLLDHFIGPVTVSFAKSSLKGLQVLGFLETRNLSFKKVVMLDVNEGSLPSGSGVDTILPQVLRQKLKLVTAPDREMLSRYHFVNLIAGAEEAVMGYSQGDGALRSRFIEQMVWEDEKRAGRPGGQEHELVHFRAKFSQQKPPSIAKTDGMMETVSQLSYSPTMLDSYLHCGRRFCFRYVMGIKEKDEVSMDVETREVGTLVHAALDRFFRGKMGRDYAHSPACYGEMDRAVEETFANTYGPDQDGGIYLMKSQVKSRLKGLLNYHRDVMPPFAVVDCEHPAQPSADIPGLGVVKLNGKLDRIDLRGGETVIVDYKTGQKKAPSYDFMQGGREKWAKKLKSVQLPFYVLLYLNENQGADVAGINSELMMLGGKEFERHPLFPAGADRNRMYQDYRQAIYQLIMEIRDPVLPFGDAGDPQEECCWCPYKVMCGRQWVHERKR